MLSVRHYPALATGPLWDWLREQVVYDAEGRFCKWLIEDEPLPPRLANLAEALCPGRKIAAAGLQAYRDGRATTPCHTDCRSAGFCLIFSLGATRTFRVHRVRPGVSPTALCEDASLDVFDIECIAGTAVIMEEPFQQTWHHQVIASETAGERLSLVFRCRPTQREA